MNDKSIRFESGRFTAGGAHSSPADLGRKVVAVLLKRSESTSIAVGEFISDPDFIVEMLRQTGRTGKFSFDPAQEASPFSGDIDAAQELKEQASRLESEAKNLADSTVDIAVHSKGDGVLVCKKASDILELLAPALRGIAGTLYKTSSEPGPLAARYGLPQIRYRQVTNSKYPAAIRWVPKARSFKFGGCYVGPAKLGKLIAASLMRGCEQVEIGGFPLTINYLVEMCKLAGQNGRFYESTEDGFDKHAPWSYRQK